MKCHLSHILPVHKACEIIGEDVVLRLVNSLLHVRQQQQTSGPIIAPSASHSEAIRQDAQLLVEGLLYKPPSKDEEERNPVPNLILQSWKRWTSARSLAMDKATLIQFIVPHMVQPHSGQSGHMGLFDCWVYALQGHSNSSAASYYGGASNSLVYFPDLLIVLAVAKQYRDFCTKPTEESSHMDLDDHPALGDSHLDHSHGEEGEEEAPKPQVQNSEKPEDGEEELPPGESPAVQVMARLAFRLFDSYQKKGSVTRDTVHRFLTDVHGEDSYKKGPVKVLLDAMFEPSDATPGGSLQTALSEAQFVRQVQETINPARPSHLLLDWMSSLFCAMIPPDEVPASVAAYLDTMEHRPRPICDMYGIAENRLFEVKRRFHSLVRTSNDNGLIQSEPMGSSGDSSDDRPDSFIAAASMAVAQPKHSIPQEAFVEAASTANEEMGNGGFLPERLARLVFLAGCRNDEAENDENKVNFWGLAHVLQFSCTAVRHNRSQPENPDQPLLRFLFSIFQLAAPGEYEDRRVLTRAQVEQMILLAVEHTEYRLERDQPAQPGLNDSKSSDMSFSERGDETANGDQTVDSEVCALLGLLPPKVERPDNLGKVTKIPMKKLIDYTMKGAAEEDIMTFDEFCQWNNDVAGSGLASRLGPIMVDLRLLAAVLFGVPPTKASMEVGLIGEIERRHKVRYPQTSVSRRGPRGTVWYIIDSTWLKDWKHLTDEVSRTDEDANDNRHTIKGPVRGLPRIDNAELLSPGGLLALRNDVRWKHDYEILPPMAWQALQAWYDGGPPIHRSVVRFVGGAGASKSKQASPHSAKAQIPTENEIELHPFFVTIYLCDTSSRGEARPFQQNYQLSRVSPMGVMLKQMCRELDVDADLARLWVMETGPNYSPRDEDKPEDWLLRLDRNIVEQRKARGVPANSTKAITLLLELKDPGTGLWPRGEDGTDWTFADDAEDDKPVTDLGDGVVGLYNMGNTCYINTSIQCISHTPMVREYFTSKSYLKDVNTTNPLGHSGQLAQVSAVLINSLWKPYSPPSSALKPKKATMPGSYNMVNAQALTPKTFKDSLGRFNDLFAGNEQHDAQEFLTFLLGGLSEDLNRIMEKPYIEAPDSDGRPDNELADIWWENHLRREMSIVVALFTGQYKSLLTCRTCKYESARFEPFSTLTVPLPEDDHMTASLLLYPLKVGASATKYCVRVKSNGVLRDVLIELAKILLTDEGVEFKESEEIKRGENGENNLGTTPLEEIDPVVVQRAKDLVIVDMRSGYIDKIAPITWKLQDIQNKDTGDLPLLHVYELDPLPATAQEDVDNDDSETSGCRARYGFIALAQRRSEVVSRNYVHPLSHRVFGTPLLIRLNDIDRCTGRALYDLVAERLHNLVPKTALRFLVKNNLVMKREESRKAIRGSGFDALEHVSRQSAVSSTKTNDEEVSAGQVPRYGFRLRVTTRDGRRCLLCPWYRCCIGCQVPDDFGPASVMDGDSIVIDWHFAVDVATSGFGMRSNRFDSISSTPSPARPASKNPTAISVKKHSSCGTGNRGPASGAIKLEECLEAFAKEEQIPEAYCSKCKDFRVQTTRMTLWRLPPILVIHLKRFQFTQTMRRKLRDLVVFPIEGLDVSKITAPDGRMSHGLGKLTMNGVATESADDSTAATEESSSTSGCVGGPDSLYDLYGVIHHQGALSGGHYVASIKSETDGQWRLFNDAQIYEIHARDVIDSSAYILFYIRRDVAKAHLADLWDVREQSNLSKQEVDQLLNSNSDRCVIS